MTPQTATDAPPTIPPLRDGDRLDRFEFARRYEAMPEVRKAELVEGVVYMPSPVRAQHHGKPHFRLNTLLGRYVDATPGVEGADNSTVRLDVVNEPQPDIVLFVEPECGGRVRYNDGYLEQAPELIVEISASTKSLDRGARFSAYQRCGVSEYIIYYPAEHRLEMFALRDDAFEPVAADAAGVLRSEAFPGLWIDGPAVLAGDRARANATLAAGLASPGHAAFAAALAAARSA